MSALEDLARVHYGALPVPDGIRADAKVPWESLEDGQRARLIQAMLAAIDEVPNIGADLVHAAAYSEQRSSPIPGMRDALRALVEAMALEAGLSADLEATRSAGTW